MSMIYPANASPFQSFTPFASEPPFALAESLPFDCDANILLLGSGDARKILFTIFNDENEKFNRSYDITCCDIEPAIIARNLLLFVMIMHDNMDCDSIWKAIYDLRIDKVTLERIQSYSDDLFHLSESLQTWESSKYSKNFRFVNSESLEIVRDYWRRYSSADNLKPSFVDNYNTAIKKIYEEYHKDRNPSDTVEASVKQFWKSGTLLSSTALPNPLFAYSNASGRFAVHRDSNPLVGFHLTPSVAKLARESLFYQPRRSGRSDLESAISSAKLQFEASCNSFRRIIKKREPSCLTIRFFVGDAISFCLGLQELHDPTIVSNCYSRPGVPRMLQFDRDGHQTPARFDVIDVGYLADRIGLLNILPNVALLLQNSCSVLYTSTRVVEAVMGEKNLLEKMLCTDIGIMCMLLGVVPAAYLTGITSQADHEYHDSRPPTTTPLNHRIMWLMTKAGDHKLEFSHVKPTCDVSLLAKFLFGLYKKMFSFESSKTRELTGSHAYTRHTFATLLRYFKRRIFIDWKECINMLLELLIEDQRKNQTNLRHVMSELFVQLALRGVYFGGVGTSENFANTSTAPIGILREQNPPDPCIMVITVPRSRLQPIYDKLRADAPRASISFQLYLNKEKCQDKDCECVDEYTVVSCVQAVFGKLISSASGNSGTIEEDPLGWEGMSDLHVCGYFSTLIIHSWGRLGPIKCGVALTPTSEMVKLFKGELGEGLSVWRTCFGHTDSIYFFDRLPGLERDHPQEVSFISTDSVAQTTESFIVDFPVLDFEKPSFTTHVEVVGPALDRLQKKDNLSVDQFSPCTLTVTFGPFQVQGNYIFPVDCANTRLRVSRVQGWIEIIAPFVGLAQRGYFTSTPFPVVLSPWGPVYNTFRPYVNFRQLPKIDCRLANRDASLNGNEAASVPVHLMSMFTNNETYFPDENIPMSSIKIQIHSLLFPLPTPKVFQLKSQNLRHVDIVFFVAGLYLNLNSRSVIGEGYIMPLTADVPFIRPDTELKASAKDMTWWRSTLPSMVEQARMWTHETSCEYKFIGIPCEAEVPICSCGQGKVTSTFTDISEWRKYAPYVTPVAISPIFPAAWLSPTRRNVPEVKEAMNCGDIDEGKKCKICGKVNSAKRCGKCMTMVYCSRECQVKDWKAHKISCGSANKGQSP